MTLFFIPWYIFLLSLGLTLILAVIMQNLTKMFITVDPIVHPFTLLELEIPSTGQELVNIIRGIFLLPDGERKNTLRAVKTYLIIDFIFMLIVYFTIATLCLKISSKAEFAWTKYLFVTLAILQIPAWLANIFSNFYLLKKLKQGNLIQIPAKGEHRNYIRMVIIKWAITLLSTVICVGALVFFWITGDFSVKSLYALMIATLTFVVFLYIFSRKRRVTGLPRSFFEKDGVSG